MWIRLKVSVHASRGNVSNMTFSNIKISTRYYHTPIMVGKSRAYLCEKMPKGYMLVQFPICYISTSITATCENGIFLSGSGGGVLSNLKLLNMNLTLKRWTKIGRLQARMPRTFKAPNCGIHDGIIHWISGQRQLLYRSSGLLTEALIEMAKQGLQVKFKEYDTLLNECINQMAIREGQRVHTHMIKTHYQPPVYLRTRLIVFYIKCSLLGDARWVFDEMPQRNVVSWTALISGYSQKGHIFEAIHLFRQMLASGTAPNEFTFATVLTSCTGTIGFQFGRLTHCLLVKSPFESHVYVGSSLLDMYAKAGKVHEARYVFENLPERDVVSCTAIISGYAQQGLYEEALELFRKLQAERMSSNYVTYTSVLTALSGLAAVEQGRQLHARIIRLELPFYAVLHNSLIHMYSKCGKFTYSRTIFNQMSERTVSSWNAMLVCYSKHGMGKQVVELFKMMRKEDKIKPDGITLLAVLSGCSHGGMEVKGVEIFNDLSSGKERVEVSIEHCGCVVDLLSRCGQVERAFQFIKEMPFQPTAAILGSLLGACWAHLYVDIGEIVARQLLEIEPENAGTYVILSNMYASAGRWEDARRVRELINARSMVKESGKSWIGPDFIHETQKNIAKT